MPAPANQTPATAIAMSLDYSATLPDVDLATPADNCDVWYSYTAQAGDTVIGFYASEFLSANYTPETTVWTGPIGSLVAYLSGAQATNVPLQMTVTPGETYYFRVRNGSGVTPSAGTTLSVSALRASNLTAPAGSILINDDTPGFPAAILSAADGSALQFLNGFPAGEEGDTNAAGSLLIYDLGTADMKYYSVTGGVLSAPSTIALDVEAIRLNPTSQAWWTATQTNPATVRRVDSAGSLGGTIWSLTHNSVFGLAVNPGETIAYYSQRTAGSAIHTFDLGSSTPGADLVAGVGSAFVRDILIPADGTIIASYVVTGTGEVTVRRYNAAGATLNTYGPYTSAIPGGTQPRMAYWGATAFGLWLHGTGADAGKSFFNKIDIATGAILLTVESAEYEAGIYQGAPTAAPVRFGNSFSCPLIILTAAITGPGTPTPTPPGGGGYTTETLIPRRLRRAPHLSLEQRTRFYGTVQVDLECGRALATGQGSNPQIMLRWSDDGGHTWSNEHWRSAGRMGQYAHRALWQRGGRSRDRIFEVVVSDPVPWNLLQMILDVQEGLS